MYKQSLGTFSGSQIDGWSTTEAARSFEDIELVASMADALTAPANSRLRAAGNMASELLATDQQLGMTEGGDLIIAHDPEAVYSPAVRHPSPARGAVAPPDGECR